MIKKKKKKNNNKEIKISSAAVVIIKGEGVSFASLLQCFQRQFKELRLS